MAGETPRFPRIPSDSGPYRTRCRQPLAAIPGPEKREWAILQSSIWHWGLTGGYALGVGDRGAISGHHRHDKYGAQVNDASCINPLSAQMKGCDSLFNWDTVYLSRANWRNQRGFWSQTSDTACRSTLIGRRHLIIFFAPKQKRLRKPQPKVILFELRNPKYR